MFSLIEFQQVRGPVRHMIQLVISPSGFYGFMIIDILFGGIMLNEKHLFFFMTPPLNMRGKRGLNSLPKRQNFTLVQIVSICRRQNKCDSKIEICHRQGEKTSWEKEKNAAYQHFLLFPQCFKSRCKSDCVVKRGLNTSS